MDVSTPQGAGAAPRLVYTTKGLQLLEVPTLQGPELSLDYFEILLSMRSKRSTAATHAECALKKAYACRASAKKCLRRLSVR